jgi:hypothetical protein
MNLEGEELNQGIEASYLLSVGELRLEGQSVKRRLNV